MGILKDIWKIVCHMASEDGFVCPGVNPYGACNVYYNAGVERMNRIGTCPYKNIRKPEEAKKKKFVNPLKGSKHKVKTGTTTVA